MKISHNIHVDHKLDVLDEDVSLRVMETLIYIQNTYGEELAKKDTMHNYHLGVATAWVHDIHTELAKVGSR